MKYQLMADKKHYLRTSDILDDQGWAHTQRLPIKEEWRAYGTLLRKYKGEPGFMGRTSMLEMEDKRVPFKLFYPIRVLEGLTL